MDPVYIVRQDPDRSSDCYAFGDYLLAREAAAIVGGWLEEEPVLGADFVEHLRAQHADDDSGRLAAPAGRRFPSCVRDARASRSAATTITAGPVDVALLRQQRDWLLALPTSAEAEGLVNLLDHMLDVAEGFQPADRRANVRRPTDSAALDRIHELFAAPDVGADELMEIALILNATGREVRDNDAEPTSRSSGVL